MAYCVHCGVELAPSERVCPLCETPVLHPEKPWKEPESYPYPPRVETVSPRINRRYGAYLATIALCIPLVISLLVDLMDGAMMNWSGYVLGAGACLFCFVLLPLYVQQSKPYLILAIDVAVAAGYLALIGYQANSMGWVVALGLPISLCVGLGMILAVYLGRRSGKALLNLLSDITVIAGLELIAFECLIDQFLYGAACLTWSLYALIALLGLGAAFRIVERKKELKEAILKRLFV